MLVPLHPNVRPFCCACVDDLDAPGRRSFIVWAVLGFGGRPNPLLFGRLASWGSRTAQALSFEDNCRTQIYVDDPVISTSGTPAVCEEVFDLILTWWLVMGFTLSWTKGRHCSTKDSPDCSGKLSPHSPYLEHEWIGIQFRLVGQSHHGTHS